MRKLYQVLHTGHYKCGDSLRAIAGDTTRLPYAVELEPEEQRVAQRVNFLAAHLPGNPLTRRMMGHVQLGARVVWGDCVFMTISMNEQHSGLVLRMFRARETDPLLLTEQMTQNKARQWIGPLDPKLVQEEATVDIPVPSAKVRAQLAAQDPHAVMAAFHLEVRVRLAQLLGLRMCLECPHCTCQDRFGANTLPMGGVCGAAVALGGAIEFQFHSSPHFHFEVFLSNVYQYHSLDDIAVKMKAKLLDPLSLVKWYEWVKHESPPDARSYHANAEHLYEEWWDRFQKREHDPLCFWPKHLIEGSSVLAWEDSSKIEAARQEGLQWKAKYMSDVQWVYGRVQEHVHRRSKTGWQPLAGCLKKGHAKRCKHDFPCKTKWRDKWRVVCPGNCRRLGRRVQGRRNSLGIILTPRSTPWTSGTHPAFAAVFRFNTDTRPNYRMPIIPDTHDDELCRAGCTQDENKHFVEVTARKAMKAGRLATGYFCGYTFKAQVSNKKALDVACKALCYANESFEGKTRGQQLHRLLVRTMSDFYLQTVARYGS